MFYSAMPTSRLYEHYEQTLITDAQLVELMTISEAKGVTTEQLNRRCRQRYHVESIDLLSYNQAQKFISALSDK